MQKSEKNEKKLLFGVKKCKVIHDFSKKKKKSLHSFNHQIFNIYLLLSATNTATLYLLSKSSSIFLI